MSDATRVCRWCGYMIAAFAYNLMRCEPECPRCRGREFRLTPNTE